ncbi:hypothetical protein H0H92_007308 [Tricholoma furcatifolium]|nr:hypothetical protein H0H92_007308 [Tricholoma furcatifolium]
MESDIQTCQSKGKLVTLSLGGATSQVGFTSDAQAEEFGESIWNMFLGGGMSRIPLSYGSHSKASTESAIRPLGSVALDGIDLDIESGSSAHYAALVNKIRSLAQGADKRYYITAAPQCPFPDAYIGTALNEVNFDAVFVQFYNNYCEVSIPSEFNFATWDTWAKTQSPNSDIKVYLGAPGSPSAAGSGYVDIDTLSTIVQEAQSQYSSFGGVMLWDADSAYTNNRYDQAVKNALTQGVSVSPTSTNILSATSSPTSSKTSSKASSSSATSKASSKASSTSTKASTKASSATTSTTSSATTTPTSSASPLPQLAFPFRDPRKTARVKRPQGFTVVPREAAPTATLNKRLFNSRFFRQP